MIALARRPFLPDVRLLRSGRGGGEAMTMSRRRLIAVTALTALAASRGWSQTSQSEPALAAPTRTAMRTRFAGRFTGDFDAMLDRRLIRLLVPYSPTLFFEDKGTIYGTAANGAQLFEEWVNKTFALGARRLSVPLTPVSTARSTAVRQARRSY